MLINRHNYEEFFLLYVDNELSVADRKAVEAFVEQNPDLEEELVMMMQSVLRPDANIVFSNKESLLKNKTANGLVNESNCEEYFVLYGDNELTNEEKDLVEKFVYKHPQYQAEFELIQQARLLPGNAITYPDKNELYRTEHDERGIPFGWWRIAAAAVVLLLLGLAVWVMMSKNIGSSEAPELAGNDNNNSKTDTQQVAVKENKAPEERKPIEIEEKTPAADIRNNIAAENKNNIKKKSNIQENINVPQESNDYVVQEKPSRVVSQSISTDIMPVDKAKTSEVLASLNEPGSVINKTDAKEVIYYVDETTEDNINVAMTSINKKPVRGLLRKVKGLFEKEDANDPEPENKKGIRIAAFEIALK